MLHFQLIATVDVAPIAAIKPEMFEQLTFRQDAPGSPHRSTESIYMRMPATISYHSMFEELATVDYLAYDAFRTLVEALSLSGLARIMIVKLKPGGIITDHIDQGAYAEATDRYHLAVATNRMTTLTSGGETLHMPAGSLPWFDKHALHCGSDSGDSYRIHLLWIATGRSSARAWNLSPARVVALAPQHCG
jgi:hypothetical protein